MFFCLDQEIITDGKIKVTAVPPSFETIYMQNIAPLTCIITNMANKDGLEVTWYADNEKITNTEIEDPLYDSSIRKYTAKAIATVCPEDWRTKNFKCSVSHPELPTVEVVTIKKPNGMYLVQIFKIHNFFLNAHIHTNCITYYYFPLCNVHSIQVQFHVSKANLVNI